MRAHDWDIRLMDFVDNVRERAFDWSSFDCLRFANDAVKAQTGEGFADDWVGDYACEKSAYRHYLRQLKADDQDDIITAIDNRLPRVTGLVPPRGAVVARKQEATMLGYTLGVCVSDLTAFPGIDGLLFDKPHPTDIAWSIT